MTRKFSILDPPYHFKIFLEGRRSIDINNIWRSSICRCLRQCLFSSSSCNKLGYYGIHSHLKRWLTKWLIHREQSVVVDGASSCPVYVSSCVPQGTILGPLMFLLCTNDIGNNCSSTLRLFAYDTFLCSVIELTSDSEHLQSDLSTIEHRSQKWLMQFNPSKCCVMRITRKHEPVIYGIPGWPSK